MPDATEHSRRDRGVTGGAPGVSGAFWFLGRHVGLRADFATCVAIVPLATLFTMLPVLVAGWGVREGAMVLAFAGVGGNSSAALAASILLGLATACASLPGAMFWLEGSRWHPQERLNPTSVSE